MRMGSDPHPAHFMSSRRFIAWLISVFFIGGETCSLSGCMELAPFCLGEFTG